MAGSAVFMVLELEADCVLPDHFGEQPVVVVLVAHASGDDCGMHDRFLGQAECGQAAWPCAYTAGLPHFWRNEGVLGMVVGLFFQRVRSANGKVIQEGFAAAGVQVESHVGQLVHQTEPEAVDAVVTQRERDDRTAILQSECRPIQVGLG